MQKAYTNYECASGNAGLGHSGCYTGAHPGEDMTCICGQPLIEEVKDGNRYKVTFETISPHVAAEMETRHGRGVWPTLSDDEWNALEWHPVTSDQGSVNVLRDQYHRLFQHSQDHEQPIRNAKMFQSSAGDWQPLPAPQEGSAQ